MWGRGILFRIFQQPIPPFLHLSLLRRVYLPSSLVSEEGVRVLVPVENRQRLVDEGVLLAHPDHLAEWQIRNKAF